MIFLHQLLRMGVSYREAITLPVRVVGLLASQARSRSRRIGINVKRSKAWPVIDLASME